MRYLFTILIRVLILFPVIFALDTALAAPLDLTGLWKFDGQALGHHKIEVAHVPVRSEKDRQKLEELQRENFQCMYSSAQVFRCKRVSDLNGISPEHLHKIQVQFSGKYLEFLAPSSSPALITDGDNAKQWGIASIVYTESGKTPGYILWELISGQETTNKAQIEVDGQKRWLNVLPQGLGEMIELRSQKNVDGIVVASQFYYYALFQK